MNGSIREALGTLALAALLGLGGAIVFAIGKANQPEPPALEGGEVADIVTMIGGICLLTGALLAAASLWRLYRSLSDTDDGPSTEGH